MKLVKKSIKLGSRDLILSVGKMAEQADAAVIAQCGDTVLIATVVGAPIKEDRGYFPLSVEYQERLYAGGRIKGSRWVKREGRPTDDHMLTARLIDRSIRPLFPNGYMRDVQVIVTVLSVDMENNPVDIAPIAVSTALRLSPLPWLGPVGTVTVGMVDGKYIVNPTKAENENSKMKLVVSSTTDSVVMIEAEANEATEEDILGGIEIAQKESVKLIKFINEFAKEVGTKKEVFTKPEVNAELKAKVEKLVGDKIPDLAKLIANGKASFADLDAMKFSMADEIEEELLADANNIVDKLFKTEVRNNILSGTRLDGRKHNEVRKLTSEVDVLPRVHGSALFTRGSTQALTVTTLGSPAMGQLIESAEGEVEKKYIHHYSMPPYSTGETGRVGSPGRREIGHGALAEKALVPVLPDKETFPYTIRLVSEIMSSNGSSSMASVCGSTLSLMNAGVPIKAPVSGIAMGLVISPDKTAILTDIAGIEDFNGDMDFKVAGTADGITALQLDVKTLELSHKLLTEALAQAKVGRATILESIVKAISKPNEEVSTFAPKIKSTKINPEKIGEIIGPGGKTIKNIIATTGADVNVEDDGTVSVTGVDAEKVDAAIQWVENIVKEVLPGEIYEGTVRRIESFGAFIEVLPGKDGMVHVSDMSEGFVKDANDVVKIDQKVQVRVKEVDKLGRINLSMIMDPHKDKKPEPRRESRGPREGGYQGNRGRNDQSRTGPHFPTSRLVSERRDKNR